MEQLETIIKQVNQLLEEAGQRVLEIYHQNFTVKYKKDEINSPLTEADCAAHKIICNGLQKITPTIPLISEESEINKDFKQRQNFDLFWLIDPLDGTKEFINKNGEFTINAGLINNGQPVAGVVFVPVKKQLYFTAGDGAYLKANGTTKKLSVSTIDNPTRATAVHSRSHSGKLSQRLFEELQVKNFKKRGSSLKFCHVATGEADFYSRFGPLWEWDTAAADAILRNAGGKVTEPDGTPLIYNKPSLKNSAGLLATNGLLHQPISRMMERLIKNSTDS